MRAFLVCVDYSDFLSITLPYNRHHFREVIVVSSLSDVKTHEVVKANNASLFMTDAFYDDGAMFNKWKALEQALTCFGRYDWLCLMDADVLWPKTISNFVPRVGNLYTPLRRMLLDLRLLMHKGMTPSETSWNKFPLHPQQREWAGYTQMFSADDSTLGAPPWHETNWRHAGGADSLFQAKWPQDRKLRPPFEVLHLGPAGENWAGRVTPSILDGSVDPKAVARRQALQDCLQQRLGKAGPARFSHERLPPPMPPIM